MSDMKIFKFLGGPLHMQSAKMPANSLTFDAGYITRDGVADVFEYYAYEDPCGSHWMVPNVDEKPLAMILRFARENESQLENKIVTYDF